MKKFFLFLLTISFGQLAYSDNDPSSSQKQVIEMQMQQLIQLDKQIENLEQQKAKIKGEMAQHIEHGSAGILPRAGKRQSREAGEDMKEIQALNQQIENLESQRQNVLRQLK